MGTLCPPCLLFQINLPGIDEQFMFTPTRPQFDPGSIWLRKLMLQTRRELERFRRKAA